MPKKNDADDVRGDAPTPAVEAPVQLATTWAEKKDTPAWLVQAAAVHVRANGGPDWSTTPITEAEFDAALDAGR